jgi:Secretion system C-terminal sorting domain
VMADSIHLLLPVLEDICDVGLSNEVSGSPISYKVDGEPGQQIFKLEWSNAGFYGEYAESNTNFNTFSFQLWLYESSNVIEYRFGPSAIKGGNYYQFGGPMSGICEDFANGKKNAWQNLWYTSGEPTNPAILMLDPNNFEETVPLNSLPSEGTVYRFGPLFVGQEELTTTSFKIFPTVAQENIWVQTPEHQTQTIRVMDISGKIIDQISVQSTLQKIDVSNWPAGIYFVQVDHLGIQRFIKK